MLEFNDGAYNVERQTVTNENMYTSFVYDKR